jgi:D-glycero-alpha-D-manno-heptose-7-phosphate kinase
MRISFAGGGTDLPSYYERHGGMVVSTAIDKYVYVFITPTGAESLQISSSDYSTFFRHEGGGEVAEEGNLRYARAFLRHYGIRRGYSIFIASEMPPGTGLGSSSSLAVALTKALAALGDDVLSNHEVARVASQIEIGKLKMPIGRQDHYAAAFGGINAIHFSSEGIRVEPLPLSDRSRRWLTESVMLFFTQEAHQSNVILAEQDHRNRAHDSDALSALAQIRSHADEARRAVLADEPQALGEIMHRSWQEKKRLARGVSNRAIDTAYDEALDAGALGGKIAGAGGGGFLMLLCNRDKQKAVSRALEARGLTRTDFHLAQAGARILVNNATT